MADEQRENDEKIPSDVTGDEPKTAAETPADDAPVAAAAEGDAAEAAAEASEAEGQGEAAEAEGDGLAQDAIARRVAALGEEVAIDAIARQEEEKLAARRAATKGKGKGKGKSALETAASKKLAKMGTRAAPRREVPVAADADPLIDRTVALRKWAKENAKAVQGLTIAAVVAIAGVVGWSYYQQKHDEAASRALAAAVDDERGRIGDPDKAEDDDAPKDPRPVFKTIGDRRDSALAKYKDVESKYPGTGAAILARLGEASLLLDKHDAPGAIAAFDEVRNSPLAKADAEVRGRALDGLGMAYELAADAKPDDAKANLDKALSTYKDMENNVDVLGFHELGMYNQSRVLLAQGDKAKAIEVLKTLHERISKPMEGAAFPYLEEVADDRLRQLDPKALPPKMPAGMGGMGGMGGPGGMGGAGGDPAMQQQMQKIYEQMMREKLQGKK